VAASAEELPAVLDGAEYFYRWWDEGPLRAINNELVMTERDSEGNEVSPTEGAVDGQ
jgi:putative transposase